MKEKSCRCGKSKKNFKMDIGPFYVGDCCLESGFDGLGNSKRPEPLPVDPKFLESRLPPKVSELLGAAFNLVSAEKPKGVRLKDMRISDLRDLARNKGIEVSEEMTKKQIIELIKK